MSVRMYPDVNILLTLDFEQQVFMRKCGIFKNAIQMLGVKCYLLSTVKDIRTKITTEVNEAGGNALRGLWNHLCMAKGGGVRHLMEKAFLNEDDLKGIQSFFREKMLAQTRDLAKNRIQILEVWAIETFIKMQNQHGGRFSLMKYLQHLVTKLNDYYVEAKNSSLRTEKELNLEDEEPINPSPEEVNAVKDLIRESDFQDEEDLLHLASLMQLKQKKGYKPIFATIDRELYECKDIVYDKIGIVVEDALYAVKTYYEMK